MHDERTGETREKFLPFLWRLLQEFSESEGKMIALHFPSFLVKLLVHFPLLDKASPVQLAQKELVGVALHLEHCIPKYFSSWINSSACVAYSCPSPPGRQDMLTWWFSRGKYDRPILSASDLSRLPSPSLLHLGGSYNQ